MTPEQIMKWLNLKGPTTTLSQDVIEGMARTPYPKDAMDHVIAFREYLKHAHPKPPNHARKGYRP